MVDLGRSIGGKIQKTGQIDFQPRAIENKPAPIFASAHKEKQ